MLEVSNMCFLLCICILLIVLNFGDMEVSNKVKHPGCYRAVSTVLHVLGVAHFVFTFVYYINHSYRVAKTDYDRFGGSLKFVTTWAVMLQVIYNVYSLIVDLVTYMSHLYDPPEIMLSFQGFFKSSMVLPISFFGGLSFWLLYAINPDTLYYDKETATPLWLIHMTTTSTMVFSTLDLILCKSDFPKLGYCIAGIFFLCSLYFIWLLIVRVVTGIWIYPVYGRMSFVKKIIGFVAANVIMLLLHLIGRALNNFLWDDAYLRGGDDPADRRTNTEEFFLKKTLSSHKPQELKKTSRTFLSSKHKDSKKSQSDAKSEAKSEAK